EKFEAGFEGLAAKAFGGEGGFECFTRGGKTRGLQFPAVRIEAVRRKRESRRRGKAFDFSGRLERAPTRLDLLPVIVELLRVVRLDHADDWLPARRHFFHDRLQRIAGVAP